MRTTLADARASRLPAVVGDCPTGSRWISLLNESNQRLLPLGHWWGTTQRVRICATDSCITFPPQIESLEVASVCGQPIAVRDQWFEFLQGGIGLRSNQSGTSEAIFRGNYCVFSDLRGTGKKLRWICDVSTDVGKTVLALGYDDNGNWIRTIQNGVYADGEVIAFAQSPGTNSVSNFASITDIQLPANMEGQSWLWEYNTADATQRMIGQYQSFETRPSYVRYFFPSVALKGCSNSSKPTPVDVIAKLAFVPVKNDSDYLTIGYLPAHKDLMQALNAAEHEPDAVKKMALIASGIKMAVAGLDAELDSHLGSGRRTGISVLGSSIGIVDPVEVLV